MLVDQFKTIVNSFNSNGNSTWNFEYGADHWQNLKSSLVDEQQIQFILRQKYLLLLWKDRSFIINDQGAIEGCQYDGEFVLTVRSKISDPTYEYKYETNIKNLESQTEMIFNEFSDCDGWCIKKWKETEVENLWDDNMDGLKVSFTIEWKE
ncbi:hypothetical protein OX284_014550 [Flavobacterium sp. SUN046]|uniref:hypothetical protein n=1 Tax=Flavobacterium sp. SUN046 TaxID=3002440 RepID=UPI002DBA4BF9|nr:hypothetical protein [Flavobacterium sp. SUN046]MEC4050656.1 hypothetical protein [Flavobacterium sp. SUN046]